MKGKQSVSQTRMCFSLLQSLALKEDKCQEQRRGKHSKIPCVIPFVSVKWKKKEQHQRSSKIDGINPIVNPLSLTLLWLYLDSFVANLYFYNERKVTGDCVFKPSHLIRPGKVCLCDSSHQGVILNINIPQTVRDPLSISLSLQHPFSSHWKHERKVLIESLLHPLHLRLWHTSFYCVNEWISGEKSSSSSSSVTERKCSLQNIWQLFPAYSLSVEKSESVVVVIVVKGGCITLRLILSPPSSIVGIKTNHH